MSELKGGLNFDIAWQNVPKNDVREHLEQLRRFKPAIVRIFPTFHDPNVPYYYGDDTLEGNYPYWHGRLDWILDEIKHIGAKAVVILFDCVMHAGSGPYYGFERNDIGFFSVTSTAFAALKRRFTQMTRGFEEDDRIESWQIYNEPNEHLWETPTNVPILNNNILRLSNHLMTDDGIMINDGFAANAVYEYADKDFYHYIDYLDKHRYCTKQSELDDLVPMEAWLENLKDARTWDQPFRYGELGIGLNKSDRQRYKMWEYAEGLTASVLAWGIYGTRKNTWGVSYKGFPKTAEVVDRIIH